MTSGIGGFAILSDRGLRARLDRRAWYERAWPTTSGLEYERACRSTSRAGLLTTGTRTRGLVTGPAWRSHGPTGLISNRDALGMVA